MNGYLVISDQKIRHTKTNERNALVYNVHQIRLVLFLSGVNYGYNSKTKGK